MDLAQYTDLEPWEKVSDAIDFLAEEMGAGSYTCAELEDAARLGLLTKDQVHCGIEAIEDQMAKEYTDAVTGGSLIGRAVNAGHFDYEAVHNRPAEAERYRAYRQAFLNRVIEALKAKGL
jgi:hypothetical protein